MWVRSIAILQVESSFEAKLWNIAVVEQGICSRRDCNQDEGEGEEEEGAQVCLDGRARSCNIDGDKYGRLLKH